MYLINKSKWFFFATMTLLLTSCFKEEPLNCEADILSVNVELSDPLSIFYDAKYASMDVPYSGNGDSIIFVVKPTADLTALSPKFALTEGAKITPASGTTLDFSNGKRHEYTVTSEDGKWTRTYKVGFAPFERFYHFSLDDGQLESKAKKYYVWDGLCSANEGFGVAKSKATPEEYPTVYDANGYKGGCAQLRTVSTGSWGVMSGKRLAAGNLYVGTFDIGYALTQTLRATHFGKPIDLKPLKYSGYYKYKAGDFMQDKAGKQIEGTDSCAIYAVVYKNHDAEGNPVYLTGEDIMTNPLIVGLAKAYDLQQTDTWTRFELKFRYRELIDPELLADHGYSLVIVCSASKDGDLFQGAVGSTLWVDELEVTYEE